MKVACIQLSSGENYNKNFKQIIYFIKQAIKNKSDLIITPETSSIITNNKTTAKKFLSNINSSIAVHNASTQFADGGEFGFGAEVGISTEKLHPRGPVGLDQLTSYKYLLIGKGQIRK